MNTAEYWISKAKEAEQVDSDRKLAEILGTKSGLLSKIKQGKTRMPPAMCNKIAKITGDDYASILVSIMADKAKDESEKTALYAMIKKAEPALFRRLEKSRECILCKIDRRSEKRLINGLIPTINTDPIKNRIIQTWKNNKLNYGIGGLLTEI